LRLSGGWCKNVSAEGTFHRSPEVISSRRPMREKRRLTAAVAAAFVSVAQPILEFVFFRLANFVTISLSWLLQAFCDRFLNISSMSY